MDARHKGASDPRHTRGGARSPSQYVATCLPLHSPHPLSILGPEKEQRRLFVRLVRYDVVQVEFVDRGSHDRLEELTVLLNAITAFDLILPVVLVVELV